MAIRDDGYVVVLRLIHVYRVTRSEPFAVYHV